MYLNAHFLMEYKSLRTCARPWLTVLSIWCAHVIILLKVTPRYIALVTKGISDSKSESKSIVHFVHVYLQVHMSAFYIAICQESGFFDTYNLHFYMYRDIVQSSRGSIYFR
jgi:hypothetical protein